MIIITPTIAIARIFTGNPTNAHVTLWKVEMRKLFDFFAVLNIDNWKFNCLKNWRWPWIINVEISPACNFYDFMNEIFACHVVVRQTHGADLKSQKIIAKRSIVSSKPFTKLVIFAGSSSSAIAKSFCSSLSSYSFGIIIVFILIICGGSAQCPFSQSIFDSKSCSPNLTTDLKRISSADGYEKLTCILQRFSFFHSNSAVCSRQNVARMNKSTTTLIT